MYLTPISIHALVKRATIIFKYFILYNIISIHALVKRATHGDYDEKLMAVISIHALVKRATSDSIGRRRSRRYFNPRPREEGDSTASALWTLSVYFNPRPREEGDSEALQIFFKLAISIHALVKRAT